jgi:hypothetical protein
MPRYDKTIETLPTPQRGQPLTARRLTTLERRLQAIAQSSASGGTGAYVGPDGILLRSRPTSAAEVGAQLFYGKCLAKNVVVVNDYPVELAAVARLISDPIAPPWEFASELDCVWMIEGQPFVEWTWIEYGAAQFGSTARFVGKAIIKIWDFSTTPAQYWTAPDCQAEECGADVPPDNVPAWNNICTEILPPPPVVGPGGKSPGGIGGTGGPGISGRPGPSPGG